MHWEIIRVETGKALRCQDLAKAMEMWANDGFTMWFAVQSLKYSVVAQ